MLRFMWAIAKLALFACVVIILANSIEWNGRTVSDQVKVSVAQAKRSGWYGEATSFATRFIDGRPSERNETKRSRNSKDGEFAPTERARLKELLKELD